MMTPAAGRRLLVAGAMGQVGREVVARARTLAWEVFPMDRHAMNLTHKGEVADQIRALRPEVVINAAAYTAVDRAESEADAAFALNRDGAAHLAEACAQSGTPLLHLSTDYVFDGSSSRPYLETDPVHPLGVYGLSKWQGEEAVRTTHPSHLILRIAWVFGYHGHNFVKTMLRLGRERAELGVVADQHGSPTAAAEVAQALMRLAEQVLTPGFAHWGTYHYVGQPTTTWHDFAHAIFRHGAARGLTNTPRLRAITTADYPTPARRPAYGVLDCTKIRRHLGLDQPPWEPALEQMLDEMLRNQGETHG